MNLYYWIGFGICVFINIIVVICLVKSSNETRALNEKEIQRKGSRDNKDS